MYQYRFDMLRHNILLFFMLQRYAIIPIRQNNYARSDAVWRMAIRFFVGRSGLIQPYRKHVKANNNRFILCSRHDDRYGSGRSSVAPYSSVLLSFSHRSPITEGELR